MRALTWPFLDRFRDLGLLVLRAGLGASMTVHGWPKLAGGADKWAKLGHAISGFGIHFGYTGWGLAAALAETVGGVLLVLGLATRPAAAALVATMAVACKMHVDGGDGFIEYSHSLEDGFAFLGLLLVGPGRYSLDARGRG